MNKTLRHHLDRFRRGMEQITDQAGAVMHRKLVRGRPVQPFDGSPRLAIVTVNYSTTRWLKLMLLTLSTQECLDRVTDIMIVDNDSRDGAEELKNALRGRVPGIQWIDNRYFLNHARGVRLGMAALDKLPSTANVILAIDTDVLFLRHDTLCALMREFEKGAVLAGEMRHGIYEVPEAQASFVAFRRDVYARPQVAPWVNHGAPSYWMQRSIRRLGLPVSDFRSYEQLYALHRGRGGVSAAGQFRPHSSYASVTANQPHYMGVPDGEQRWQSVENNWLALLERGAEAALADYLAGRFGKRRARGVTSL